MLPVFGIHETSNPEMPKWLFYQDFFLNSWIFVTRPPMMEVPQSFCDFMKSNAEMLWHPVILIPEVLTCEMPTDS
jgi:hypothetical protein